MGSRSYFHDADQILVLSRGKYVGVDPLNTASSHGRGRGDGWMLNLSRAKSEEEQSMAAEAHELFAMPEPVMPASLHFFTAEARADRRCVPPSSAPCVGIG